MIIGYARVSTTDQDIGIQISALEEYGCEKIYQDHISGSVTDRAGYNACMDSLRENDTLVVWKVDRLGRTVKQLIGLIDDLAKRKVKFISITDNLDASTTMGKMMFHLLSMFAEMERSILIERTRAGMKKARARGRCGGRKFKLTPGQRKALVQMYADGETPVNQLASDFGISVPAVYRYIKLEENVDN